MSHKPMKHTKNEMKIHTIENELAQLCFLFLKTSLQTIRNKMSRNEMMCNKEHSERNENELHLFVQARLHYIFISSRHSIRITSGIQFIGIAWFSLNHGNKHTVPLWRLLSLCRWWWWLWWWHWWWRSLELLVDGAQLSCATHSIRTYSWHESPLTLLSHWKPSIVE